MKYVELSCRTNFSFLTGASHPEELVEQAVSLGLSGLAITDKDGVYGMPKAFRKAKFHSQFKFIVGATLTFNDHPPLILLVRDRAGYGLLCRILTASHAGKPKGENFLEWAEFLSFLKNSKSQGLIALAPPDEHARHKVLKDFFDDRIYVNLTRYLDGLDRERTQKALEIQKQCGISLVATNDVLYHVKERKNLQDILTSIRAGAPLKDLGFKLQSNGERHLKSPAQMVELFSDLPEALENTLQIAEQCSFSPRELRYRYPSEWIPEGHSAQSYLEDLVWKKLPGRCFPSEKMTAQLKHELDLIARLEFADYFLTIYDIVEFARSRKILCQGRGSAANSAVCYILGITAIDPIQMELLFERFISVERGEPPDIDVDFEHERREEVIQYIYEKYGRDRAGMVSAVVTYRKRSALREVCKAFSLPVGTLSAKKVERDFEKLSEGITTKDLREKITKWTDEMRGFPRHLSIHSGGFTLSADSLVDIVPIEPARMEGRTIIQWDKYDLDELGLLKIDILSLGMLSALRKTLDMVGLELHQVPPDDPPTYQMIQRADTVGTFQIESRAQMSMLGRLLPKNFYDLVVEVAIVRPGPIVGQMVHPYLKRRRGLEKVTYPHPKAKAILEKTLGIPLFQEQVMKLAIELAFFTPGEADELRRSIGAWRSSGSIQLMGQKLIAGFLKNGIPASFAEQIFKQIQGFSQYGFPESHAASFALLAYVSCFLKCHYPGEFVCALINSQPMGFYSNHSLVSDAVRHGVEIRPISLNKSQWDCTLEDKKAVRMGLRVVKGLSEKGAHQWILQRDSHPFQDFTDFMRRAGVRSDVLSRLAMGGAFGEFGFEPREALWQILEYKVLTESPQNSQLCLFNTQDYNPDGKRGGFANLEAFEAIQQDFNTYGLSTRGHPMSALRRMFSHLPPASSKEIRRWPSGRRVKAAGLILFRQRPPTAKGMTFSTLEDEDGFLDLVIHPPVYEKCKDVFLNHCFVIVRGLLQRDAHTVNIIVKGIEPIWSEPSSDQTPLVIEPVQYFH